MKGRDGMLLGKGIQWKRKSGNMVRNSAFKTCQGGAGGGRGHPRRMFSSESLP